MSTSPMPNYISVTEYAALVGISRQAVMKQIRDGKIEAIHKDDPNIPKGKWYVAKPNATNATNATNSNATNATNATNEIIPQKTDATNATNPTKKPPKSLIQITKRGLPGSRGLARQADERLAALKALICDDVLSTEKRDHISRREAIRAVLQLYESGLTHKALWEAKGKLSERTIYNWLQAYKNGDHMALAENWAPQRGHLVHEADLNFLTGYMMSSSDRKLGSGLKLLHYWNRRQGREQYCSDRTLRRAFDAWKQRNHAIYSLRRHGEKYLREHLLPMQEMDWSLVRPGELWLSDGKTLNYFVINPITGKASRPTLITWFDAATRMPVGFDLDFTENRRVVLSAFKNGLMFTGYCPRYVKLDNGPAFRAQDVSGRSEVQRDQLEEERRIEDTQIKGALYRCGVEDVSFGIPYNSTSKAIIERWHGILEKGIESLMPAYSGNSVSNKPATMSRNEKFIQSIENNQPITLLEAKLLINEWILEIYGLEPHRGLKGRKPRELYEETLPQIPAEQRKSAEEFWWLMLGEQVAKLKNNGVRLRGIDYWHEDLIEYVGQEVGVRYEQMDDRYVFVFSKEGRYICQAYAQTKSDPLATVRDDGGIAAGEITYKIKRQRSLVKKIRSLTTEFNETAFGSENILQTMIENSQPAMVELHTAKNPPLPPAQLPVAGEPEPDEDESKAALKEMYQNLGL